MLPFCFASLCDVSASDSVRDGAQLREFDRRPQCEESTVVHGVFVASWTLPRQCVATRTFLSVVRIQIFDYTATNTVYFRGYVDEPRNISSVVRFYIDSYRKFPDPVE